jgi:hypothetical protein
VTRLQDEIKQTKPFESPEGGAFVGILRAAGAFRRREAGLLFRGCEVMG